MSADDPAALDLAPIRVRLEQTASGFWENDCKDLDDASPQDLEFIYNAPGDVAALLLEIERLRAENTALREMLASDPNEELARLGADFVKEWCDGL